MEDRHLWIALCVLMIAAISQASQDISAHTGENLTIPCPIQVDSDLRFLYWRKNGKTIYNSGENSSGNYSVTDTTSLVISDVSNGDAGNYSCKVVFLSLETAESDVIEVYVTDLTVSQCSSSQQGSVDDCSCHVDGTNLTSLVCTASGFPHSPAIQWTHNGQPVGFSSTDLKQFQDNVTLICNAWDMNLATVSAQKTVCIFYNQSFHLPIRCPFTSCSGFSKFGKYHVPCEEDDKKTTKDEHPLGNSFQDMSSGGSVKEEMEFQRVHEGMKKDEGDNDSVDIPRDCYNDVIAWKKAEQEQQASPPVEGDPVDDDDMPLVGRVLLDDLNASNEQSREVLKCAINWLMKKRVEPYEDLKLQSRTSVSLKTSVLGMSMQGNVIMDTSGNRDVTYVAWVLKQLDRIGNPTDRDECEILITKPDFQAITDESQIPKYSGKSINVSIGGNIMSSTLNGERNPLSDHILAELQSKNPQERTAARNAISQIILEFIRKDIENNSMINSSIEGFVHSNSLLPSYGDLLDEDSRLVALWTSKIAKLEDDIKFSISGYLHTPKSSIPKKSSAGLKEEGHHETLKTPSMENLPKDSNERVQID